MGALRRVIFVIDSETVSKKTRDVAELLYDVLVAIRSSGTPLLIVCNKQDLDMVSILAQFYLLLILIFRQNQAKRFEVCWKRNWAWCVRHEMQRWKAHRILKRMLFWLKMATSNGTLM